MSSMSKKDLHGTFRNFLWIPGNADLTREFLSPCFISYQSWQDPDICWKMFRKENVLTPNVFHQIILHIFSSLFQNMNQSWHF